MKWNFTIQDYIEFCKIFRLKVCKRESLNTFRNFIKYLNKSIKGVEK